MNNDLPSILSKNVRRRMDELEMNEAMVAGYASVSITTVCNVMDSMGCSLTTLAKLAHALRCSAASLIYEHTDTSRGQADQSDAAAPNRGDPVAAGSRTRTGRTAQSAA